MFSPYWSEGVFHVANALPEGEVHLWRFNLDQEPLADVELLSEDEQSRLATIRRPEAARRYLNTRIHLRCILASYLDQPPDTLRFIVADGGKPELEHRPLQFNLSHSHELGLLGISRQLPVGVDLEKFRNPKYSSSIARRMFSVDIQRQLSLLNGDARQHLFFRQWTAMEARQKALGRGIFETRAATESMHCQHFIAEEGFIGAIATESSHEKPLLRFFNSPTTAYDAA
ncbi:4'-phosphopantetheinyl transferase family protein [Thiolapillus sp.]